MPFAKGISGNPQGRPKGSRNQINLRDTIRNFLDSNWDLILKDFKKVSPEKRLDFVSRLMAYSVPKLNSIDYNATVEVTLNQFAQMTFEQRQEAIKQLHSNLKLTG